ISRLHRRIGPPLLLIAVSSFVALSLCEVGLRLFRPVQYLKPPTPIPPEKHEESLYRPSVVPGLSYEMVPGRNGSFEGMSVRTNRLGTRGPAPTAAARSPRRGAVVGGSACVRFG